MNPMPVRAAVDAVKSTAASLGLEVDDAFVIHESNRLTVRLLPCDVVARVAPISCLASAEFELQVARRLAEARGPAAALASGVEPRVHVRDGFVINLWSYYEPLPELDAEPAEYANALMRLHAGMRNIDIPTPRFTDRIAEAQGLVDDHAQTPDLIDRDRQFLSLTLRKLERAICQRGAPEQLLHGEPHPGNILRTKDGLLFIDFETCCRGPVEFDLAHLPEAVAEHYPGVDPGLLHECRLLATALVAAWRWDRDDQFPNGRQMGIELLGRLRAADNR